MERAGRSSAAAEESVTPPAIALTAALVIIGDELLSGKVDDVNTHFICRELHALGWQVSKACISQPHKIIHEFRQVHDQIQANNYILDMRQL